MEAVWVSGEGSRRLNSPPSLQTAKLLGKADQGGERRQEKDRVGGGSYRVGSYPLLGREGSVCPPAEKRPARGRIFAAPLSEPALFLSRQFKYETHCGW